MELEARYKKTLLWTTTAITAIVFLTGVFLGWGLDNFKTNSVLDTIQKNELDSESYLVGKEFTDAFGERDCNLLNLRIRDLSTEMSATGKQIGAVYGSNAFDQKDVDSLERKYFILETRFLTQVHNFEDVCGDSYNTVLFFYKTDSPESIAQGTVLDKLNKEYNNSIIVLSFNVDYNDEPLIYMIKSKYEITDPALVINEEIVLTGLVQMDELKEAMQANESDQN